MKIALLHFSAPPVVGGVESVLAHHARLMAAGGHSVTIIAGRGDRFDPSIPVRIIPTLDSRHPRVMQVQAELHQGQRTGQFQLLVDQISGDLLGELAGFDLLVAHNVASLNKNLALTAALHGAYRKPGFPRLILWHHDLSWTRPRHQSELHPGQPWDLLRDRWPGATHVTISENRRHELASLLGIPPGSIRVIPNGVELDSFLKLEPLTVQVLARHDLIGADPLLLLPARLTPRKNIELALQVLAELRRHYPNAVLLVTGPEGPHSPANAGYKRKLLDLRDELQLQDAAIFLAESLPGFLPDAVIADFYKLADALIFPSREEGFGIPLIEAAFSALPVFCADLPVLQELGGGDVSYFKIHDSPRKIAEQIHARLEGEATSRWSRRARQRFTWASIYRKEIEPLIMEVMQWQT